MKWTFEFAQNGISGSDGLRNVEAVSWSRTPQTLQGARTTGRPSTRRLRAPDEHEPRRLPGRQYRRGQRADVRRQPEPRRHVDVPVGQDDARRCGCNGTKLIENADPLDGNGEFKVPAAEPEYKLASSVRRSAKVGAASTRIDTNWTFRSKKTTTQTQLPLSTARFNEQCSGLVHQPWERRGGRTFPIDPVMVTK
ncbi:hypothetical protein [Streptomyces atratus]|uniref:hypothetical protein n=1 Tax=Streptomyces atratus TaxID=1893 RepID=UPI003661215D